MGKDKTDAEASENSDSKKLETKTCPECGVTFARGGESYQKWAARKYCSDLCKKEAKNRQNSKSRKKTTSISLLDGCDVPELKALLMAAKTHNVDCAHHKDFLSYLTMAYELGKSAV